MGNKQEELEGSAQVKTRELITTTGTQRDDARRFSMLKL